MRDPLHQPGGPATFWTTINAEENLEGVTDPLSGSFWLEPVSTGTLGAFADMGVIPEREVVFHPDEPDRNIVGLIRGRYCVNVDLVRRLADLMPGTSGDAMERDLFGNAREGIPAAEQSFARYPVIAVKAPRAALGVAKKLNRAMPQSQVWWRESIARLDGANVGVARGSLLEGHRHMRAMMRPHTLGTMLIQGVLERVREMAVAAGHPGLELELSRGLASLEEIGMLSMLWDVSRELCSVEEFLSVYGFHGPGESAVSNTVWREDPRMLEPIIDSYRAMPDERSPALASASVASQRAAAAEMFLACQSAVGRPGAKFVLNYGDKLWALRETGKAAYLHGIDVVRAASRIIGRYMAARGLLADAGDVAFLTIEELIGESERDWREDVEFRRLKRADYDTFDVPQTWTGEPPRVPKIAEGAGITEVIGLGASPGVAEGVVRVVRDPTLTGFADGEILVCRTSDPSWATLFLMAAASVIDVGAPSSHAAIISRELGIPCVINTRTGTQLLKDGDRVRVDGAAGTVDVLSG